MYGGKCEYVRNGKRWQIYHDALPTKFNVLTSYFRFYRSVRRS